MHSMQSPKPWKHLLLFFKKIIKKKKKKFKKKYKNKCTLMYLSSIVNI